MCAEAYFRAPHRLQNTCHKGMNLDKDRELTVNQATLVNGESQDVLCDQWPWAVLFLEDSLLSVSVRVIPTWLCEERNFLFTISGYMIFFFFLWCWGWNLGTHRVSTRPLRSMPSLCVYTSVGD